MRACSFPTAFRAFSLTGCGGALTDIGGVAAGPAGDKTGAVPGWDVFGRF